MMSHRLDVPEATFQRAGGSKRRRSRNAARKLHRLDGAAHRVGHRKQEVRFLLQRVGLDRRRIFATLRSAVSRSNKRPERRIASARPNRTWADDAFF